MVYTVSYNKSAEMKFSAASHGFPTIARLSCLRLEHINAENFYQAFSMATRSSRMAHFVCALCAYYTRKLSCRRGTAQFR